MPRSRRVFEKLGYALDESAEAWAFADEPGDLVRSLDRATFERVHAAQPWTSWRTATSRVPSKYSGLRAGDVVRSLPVPPIRIYYQRRAEGFWVVRLYHQARRLIIG